MSSLNGKQVLLGITGGIAAYKSADLVRRLREAGAEVRVVMTAGATQFVTPLTFAALSGHPVATELFDAEAEGAMGHIALARWADLILVAPASADFMARLAHGRADDLLATLCLATAAPIALAPAMNRQMWANAATQANRQIIAERGIRLFGPCEGEQACGDVGEGRMLEPAQLVERADALFATGALAGFNVMVTAGPTLEDLDPVRFIGNRSSGRMGYATAAAAAEAGAKVVLVSGPTALPTPAGVKRLDVRSAHDMHEAVMNRIERFDIFIAAAAVADYRPVTTAEHKIKKQAERMTVEFIRNPDILRAVACLPDGPFTVGFAAETQKLTEHARAKLREKGADMIAANRVGIAGSGFEAEENALTVYWNSESRELPRAPKDRLARALVALIAERYRASTTA